MRMTFDRINENLTSWNTSHPELPVVVQGELSGYRIVDATTFSPLVWGDTPGKCWDAWCIYAKAYNTGWRMANLGRKGV